MNVRRLVFRNLLYYRRPYLAVLAGVIVGTAVLTGALLVGDSVRGSLGRLTDIRLGATRWAMQTGDRYFRAALAGDLTTELEHPVIPALLLEGIGVNTLTGKRIPNIQVVGVDDAFGTLWNASLNMPSGDGVIISKNLSERLGLSIGDPMLIRLPKGSKAPQNAPFVANRDPQVSLRLTISAIAKEEEMGRFSLKNNQQAAFNVFIALETLSSQAGLNGLANLLLVPGLDNRQLSTYQLDTAISRVWRAADAGIRSTNPEDHGWVQLTTDRIFFDDQTAQAICTALPEARPLLTYLANTLTSHGKETPYSFVAAVDSGIVPTGLFPGEILVTDWLADDLNLEPGDSLYMTYFVMGPLRRLSEKRSGFTVSGIIPLKAIPYGELMMPDFPGMSDAGHCSEWEAGTPVNLDRIRDKDEVFWNRYKGTPKAFITLADGKRLWDNPFGTVTAFRLAPRKGALDSLMMTEVHPSWYNFTFSPVWEQGKSAAANSTDFGGLFLSLSFFLIASSLLLTALLFSLHAHTRISEVGVLSGLGFRKPFVTRILLAEALLVVFPGVILGAAAGILYNKLIIIGLNTLWQDAVRTSMLRMDIRAGTMILGMGTGFLLSAAVLYLTLRRLMKRQISGLVKGAIATTYGRLRSGSRVWMSSGIALLITAVALLVWLLAGPDGYDAGLFLVTGAVVMAGGTILVYAFLIRRYGNPVTGRAGLWGTVLRLGSANRSRTMAAITLLALGTFTVVITGANRKTFFGSEQDRTAGTGGFLLWTETTLPILYDLNTPAGKAYYALDDEESLQDIRFIQLHRVEGNDASCLNLNQVPQPMMLGVPERKFDSLGAFRFVNLLPEVDPEHPWAILNRKLASDMIPAYADQTVITWGLMKQVGDALHYVDEAGKELKVKLMGGLANSIFQGHILVSDSLLKSSFPAISGSRTILVDGPFPEQDAIGNRLEELFTDYGMTAVPASERLAEFNSVENTYLTIFMMLGALGVLVGTVGFGVVLWRHNLDRSRELALYLALGFRKRLIRTMLITEYLMILGTGIFLGILGAVAGILPSFLSPAYRVPGGFLAGILAIIWISGAIWVMIPVYRIFPERLIRLLGDET